MHVFDCGRGRISWTLRAQPVQAEDDGSQAEANSCGCGGSSGGATPAAGNSGGAAPATGSSGAAAGGGGSTAVLATSNGGAFSGASGEARPGCHLLVSAFAK